jgi:MFS family permease
LRHRPAAFAATLAAGMAVSTFLMVVFGTLAPFFAGELGLSRAQVGALTTALYITGALLSPAAGPLVDRHGGRRLMYAIFAITAAALIGLAVAGSYAAMFSIALFGGLAVALGNPVTNLLIATHTTPARQGLVIGLKQSGVQLGIFLGGAALPTIAAAAGWRAAVLSAVVLPALGFAGLALAVPPDNRQGSHQTRGDGRAPVPVAVRWLAVYGLGMGLGVSAVGAYLPLYAVERLGVPSPTAGWLTAVMGAVGVAARVVWGHAADRSDIQASRQLAGLAAVSVTGPLLLLAAQGVGVGLAWLGASVLGASAAAWNAVGMLAVVRGVPRAIAGRASGVVLLGFYFGFIVGPPLFGVLVDATGSYVPGWVYVAGMFTFAAGVATAWQARSGSSRGPSQES